MQNSPDLSEDPQPDLALMLPLDVFYEVMRVLRGALPRPEVDEPAAWSRRDRAALAAVAGLLPETAAEARLAAQFVVADAYSLDSLRRARVAWQQPDVARQCEARAMRMMGECKSAMRLLQRMQAMRRLTAENPAASGRAEWVEHAVTKMMAEALEPAPVVPPAPEDCEAVPVEVATLGANEIVAAATAAVRLELVSRGATDNRKSRRETAARLARGVASGRVGG